MHTETDEKKRKKLAESFQLIAGLIGYRTSMVLRKSGVYDVTTFSHAKKSRNNFVTNIIEEEAKENIWCVKTAKNKSIKVVHESE